MITAPIKGTDKREARRQERRQAILAVARKSFFELGYSATSMSAICAELGGSKGTLWSYFPSKEELFGAVLEQETSAYRQELADLLQPTGDLAATVLAFCRSFITKVVSPEAIRLHRLVSAEAGRFPEIGRIFYDRAPREAQQLIAAFLASQIETGAMRSVDPLRAARALTSLCMGSVHQRMLWGLPPVSDEEREAEAHFAAETFLNAFARTRSRPSAT